MGVRCDCCETVGNRECIRAVSFLQNSGPYEDPTIFERKGIEAIEGGDCVAGNCEPSPWEESAEAAAAIVEGADEPGTMEVVPAESPSTTSTAATEDEGGFLAFLKRHAGWIWAGIALLILVLLVAWGEAQDGPKGPAPTGAGPTGG